MYGTHLTDCRSWARGRCAAGRVRHTLPFQETPVGVEPTWTGLQPVAVPSGSSVNGVACMVSKRRSVFSFSKSSGLARNHQKRPDLRQHFLNRLPLPQGQRSFRPSFSSNSLSPWTMRTPRFTFVSDGNPFRRLLIVSKKALVVVVAITHGAPPSGVMK